MGDCKTLEPFASEGFKRFTVAHELGHYFLEGHIPGLFAGDSISHTSESGFISDDHYEREADYFAAGLLMPNELFARACNNAGRDLSEIEKLAALCQTSLTATAIRFAGVTEDAVAVVCSKDDRILYCFMSKRLRGVRGLTWPKKGSGLPSDTATANFNRNLENVLLGKRLTSTSNLGMWFDGLPEVVVGEDVVGLGEYGRTLTVLTTSDLPDGGDEAKVVEEEEDLENMLPSDRWRALDKRRRKAEAPILRQPSRWSTQ